MTTVEIVRPCPWLATNDRLHWAAKAARTKRWRAAAATYARVRKAAAVPGPVTIHATIHKPTRHPYDLDGVTPTVKACIDGLRDAGVLDEDTSDVVTSLTLTNGEPRKPGSVVIRITALEEA